MLTNALKAFVKNSIIKITDKFKVENNYFLLFQCLNAQILR